MMMMMMMMSPGVLERTKTPPDLPTVLTEIVPLSLFWYSTSCWTCSVSNCTTAFVANNLNPDQYRMSLVPCPWALQVSGTSWGKQTSYALPFSGARYEMTLYWGRYKLIHPEICAQCPTFRTTHIYHSDSRRTDVAKLLCAGPQILWSGRAGSCVT